MGLRAGFAQVDITPPLGTEKAGWLRHIVAEEILDPVYARTLVLESNGTLMGFVSLDLLSVRWTQVDQIRTAAESLGIPKANLMVAATHNHAGPAIVCAGGTTRDDRYIEFMVDGITHALQQAITTMVPAKLAVASGTEGRISFIRRFIMKDGSVRTHPPAGSPEIRCAEGVMDPELGVLGVKDYDDKVLGFIINFACHPTHHGGGTAISAGWPGQLSLAVKQAFGDNCVTLFLNGAFGNVHHANPFDPEYVDDMNHIGSILAEDVQQLIPAMEFADDVSLAALTTTLQLPIRDIDGPYGLGAKYPQRFPDDEIYEASIRKLRAKKAQRDYALAEVQCLRIGDEVALVGIPAEYFVQLGLRIKMESPLPYTYIAGAANGMLGYVPHREAFERGGYETTIGMWSKLVPQAGDMLTDAAIDLINQRASSEEGSS